MDGYAAVVLAGGGARRLGGVDKPGLPVAGHPLVERMLAAVADAAPRIVVGPPRPLPAGVLTAWEQPPGSGPAAAVAAGLALVPDHVPQVALLAGDLPLLTAGAVRRLRAALTAEAAVFTDQGRRQFLCAVWRHDALRRRLSALDPPEGVPLKRLYADAEITDVETPDGAGPPPWYDCDTGADIAQAEAWLRERRTPTGT